MAFPSPRSVRQYGMTLIECLISLTLGVLILAGLSRLVDIGVNSYSANRDFHRQHVQAEEVMRRIAWAIDHADRKKKTELSAKTDDTTSGDWFYATTSDGKQRKLSYSWSSAGKVLNEIDDSGIARAILDNVTGFGVTSPATTDGALIAVSLSVGPPGNQTTLLQTRRLGNAW